MNKKIFYITAILLSFLFINDVKATTYYSYTNDFSETVGGINKIITSVEGTGTLKDEALYLNGFNTYTRYNINQELGFEKMTIEFNFYKSNSDSYSRMLYIGGHDREIEVKGSSNSMYINGNYNTGWVQNSWNTMKLVFENGLLTYYVNDNEIMSEEYSSFEFLQFGKGLSSNNMFTGYIDNLKIYANLPDDNVIVFNNAWYKGNVKIDTTDKKVYVKSAKDTDYSLALSYTKPYFVVSYVYGTLYFTESDIDTIYSSVKCSYETTEYTCFTNSSGDVGFYSFFNTYSYDLNNKRLRGELPFGKGSAFENTIKKANVDVYSLTDNSLIFKKNITTDLKPNIKITKENSTINSVTLNVEFSLIDNTKYLYMYKYGIDNEWTTMTLTASNNFSKTFTNNDTLYVQILDRSSNELVTSATYTISSISSMTPSISIGLLEQDTCLVNNIKICQKVGITTNIKNFNDYSIYLFNEITNEEYEYKENNFNYIFYENSSIEVRIVDNNTMDVVNSKTYLIHDLNTTVSTLGQYITSKCEKVPTNEMYVCKYYIYNYNPDEYRYYYGESTSKFDQIYDNNIGNLPEVIDNNVFPDIGRPIYQSSTNENIFIYERSYTSVTTAYFKIVENTSDKVIYTASFKITADGALASGELSAIEKFINDHILSKLGFVSQTKEIFNSFLTYEFDEDAKPPVFTLDLSFMNLSPITIEMAIDNDTRFKAHSLIKLFASIGLLITFVKNMSKFVKAEGGD